MTSEVASVDQPTHKPVEVMVVVSTTEIDSPVKTTTVSAPIEQSTGYSKASGVIGGRRSQVDT